MVKRRDLYYDDMVEAPDGKYVEYSDYQELESKLDRYRIALEGIRDCNEDDGPATNTEITMRNIAEKALK